MIDYIAVHENAARGYDEMAAEATSELTRRMYRELAAKRRALADFERSQIEQARQRAEEAQRAAQDAPDFYWKDYGMPI